jgi:hypothetical protein
MSNGEFSLLVSGDAGPDYTVLAATNLGSPVVWTTLLTTNPPALPFLFEDQDTPDHAQRFYKVQLGL